MVRIGSIAILVISVFLMIRGISETWKNKPGTLPVSTKIQQKEAPENVPEDITFNPQVPAILPDFKGGYLFNPERTLVEEAEPKDSQLDTDMMASQDGVQTDVNGVTYSGAIITDTFRWAIITYTAAPPETDNKKSPARRPRARKPSSTTTETTKVMEGDMVGGYKVASIEEEKIVFSNSEETIEKFIYDPDKNRAKPPTRTVEIQKPPRPGSPTGVAPSAPVAPVKPATAQMPAQTPRVSRTTTGRRLVVSRKPPTRPDTSKVSRRRRTVGSPVSGSPPIPGH